ncbi:phage holin family protein [Enterococcus dispar]|uniref:phage holin family protein n=1 Tax=Enterococcus dispar TaxID=44009 RepID=UPI0023314A1A|nr:phage holin family protein [Enterococcus dispar]WCG33966.1 phage holin family protein [Enterococcus dispar]
MSYLFGGGVPVMGLYLIFVALDITTGYIKALKNHSWMSSINLEGLLYKFVAFATIIAAAGLDKLAPFLGITLPINVALIWTVLLCLYEFGSILENAHAVGLKIAWLQKWLDVFEDNAESQGPKDKKIK